MLQITLKQQCPIHLLALHILQLKQIRVREQVAVVTRQHDACESVIIERATRHRLAARLERHGRQRDQDLPVQLLFSRRLRRRRRGPGYDCGGEHDQRHLRAVREDEHPALGRREVAVESREDEGAQAEGEDGGSSFYPADSFGGRDEA